MDAPELERTGGCLCGSVRYRADGAQPVLQCHCENCRRLSGNFVAAARTATESLQIEDSDGTFRWYDLPYARYGFCQACGATLFFRATERSEHTSVMVGTMDDSSGLELGSVWFASDAQDHNLLDPTVPHYDGNG